jgi:hypothetical protein
MNLIQIQEHLKDLPMQVIQSYANGANPEVPPYMALAEMQRRQTMEQRASQQQQAQQGPMPTVKEQIEQSAGLAGFQTKQVQQAEQQAQQQQATPGGPTPEDIPQPQPQPSPEQQGIGTPPQPQQPQPTQQMAEGGLTAAQGIENLQPPEGMFEYSDGGILGYAGPQGSVVRNPEEEKKFKIMQILNEYKSEESKPSAPASDPNADQPQRAARPASTETRPSRNQPSDFLNDPSFMEATKRGMEVKDAVGQVADIKAAQRAAGAKENYGEDQRKRYEEEDAQYKEALKNRGFNNFINVMSGIGQGGLRGAAPAYLQQTAAQEAADIAHKRRLNAARNELDKQEQDTALGIGSKGFEAYNTQRNESTAAASRLAAEQQRTLASQALEVERNKNELARLEQSGAQGLALEELRNKNQALIHQMDRDAAAALARFTANAPTNEMKEFEAYKNKVRQSDRSMQYKTERELFVQYQKDKYAGYLAAIPEKAAGALDVQESKNLAGDYKLKTMTDQWARETDPEKKMDLLMRINARKALLTNGGIAQGAPTSTDLSAPPPNAVRLKQ